jgi:hypothetical protein
MTETKNNESNFFLYNIVNFEEPKQIFIYFVILVIFIFIFTKIDFSISLFIGLIFFTILLFYLHTDRNKNFIDFEKKLDTKFKTFEETNISETSNKNLKNYPDIVDFIFYLSTLKNYNPNIFQDIISLFNRFIELYDSVNIDKSLASTLFKNMTNIKVKIINNIESFLFTTNNAVFTKQINKFKIRGENLLNKYLDKILLINKKYNYYNGYNINTNILTNNNILEYNFSNTNYDNIRGKSMVLYTDFI